MKLEISLSNNSLDQRLESIATMFTTSDQVPTTLLNSMKSGHILMVGMRPLMGTHERQGESLYGRHWVCLDPKDSLFQTWLDNNTNMDARLVKVLTNPEIVGMALVGNPYIESYMEEEFEERMKMLSPQIKKLEGKTWAEIGKRLKKAYAKGLVLEE